ncbi:MAG: pyruvate kinase [Halothermotrichaceae bacterium]
MRRTKTKIVCTLGPATNSRKIISQLVESGMDVARLNFSHGNYEEHGRRIKLVRDVEDIYQKTVGIMLDTRGPEIRTGDLEEDNIQLKAGQEFILTTEKMIGNKEKVSVSYDYLTEDIKADNRILIDDGLIELKVIEVKPPNIICKVINGGTLGSRKGVNIPGVSLELPSLTKKDKEDIKFGIEMGVNFIAASFVRRAKDVKAIRAILDDADENGIYIIAKIESQQGVNNINEILEVADGIMIARGDLGVEIPPEKVPVVQKTIISKCNDAAKPVITATQMLESMIRNPRPTRAEASDVANAILDGTDAIMLSGESAMGNYPREAVDTMDKIAREIESSNFYQNILENYKTPNSKTVTEAISFASCKTAKDLSAECIITATSSGFTARMVSKYRPLTPIVAVTHSKLVKHYLTLKWGVYPLQVIESESTDEMIENSIKAVIENGFVDKGDLVTITAGVPVAMSGTTNLIEVLVV